jgi:hypothetical protein
MFTKPRTSTLKRSLYLKPIGNCDILIQNTLKKIKKTTTFNNPKKKKKKKKSSSK